MGVGPRCPDCNGALKSETRGMHSKNPSFCDVPGRLRCKRCCKLFPMFRADPLCQTLEIPRVPPQPVSNRMLKRQRLRLRRREDDELD